ncbi:MAG: hypothetical protein ACUVT2_08080 [Thiobacillaceae bacterium]
MAGLFTTLALGFADRVGRDHGRWTVVMVRCPRPQGIAMADRPGEDGRWLKI